MLPKSDSLFHFTKSASYLTAILKNGFLPRYSLEDSSLLGIDYTAYPMVCFCDIPISRIAEHAAFYGSYGIGMSKDWGLKSGLEPLLYAVPDGRLIRVANGLDNLTNGKEKEAKSTKEVRKEIIEHFFDILPMIKPVSGTMIVGGAVVEKEFLQESEWRFVPDSYSLIWRENFEEERDAKNAEVASYALEFTPSDVRYLFVKMDHEIPALFDFIQTQLGHFPMNDLKILTSRIVSLETLNRDI